MSGDHQDVKHPAIEMLERLGYRSDHVVSAHFDYSIDDLKLTVVYRLSRAQMDAAVRGDG